MRPAQRETVGVTLTYIESGTTICIDNQVAISTTTASKQMPGQYLVKEIQKALERERRQLAGKNVTLRWIPGHIGVEGNEKVDDEAKEAARGASSQASDLPQMLRKPLPISKAAELQTQRTWIAHESTAAHLTSTWIDKLRTIDPSMPSASFAKYAKCLSRRHAAILIQLRSGHVALNTYLHRIGKSSTPLCQECRKSETTYHYLIECRRYTTQRRKLEQKLKRNARSIRVPLSNPLATADLFKFIGETGRFKDLRKDWDFTKEETDRWKENTKKKKKNKSTGRGRRIRE